MPEKPAGILLVEDNPHDAELTMHALKQHNLADRVQVVPDGAEALDLLLGHGAHAGLGRDVAPKVIFLDLQLPKVDGLEVLRQLKADPRARLIPVVVLSSSRDERDRMAGYELGANSFISKPVGFERFREVVHQLGVYWLLLNQPPPLE